MTEYLSDALDTWVTGQLFQGLLGIVGLEAGREDIRVLFLINLSLELVNNP